MATKKNQAPTERPAFPQGGTSGFYRQLAAWAASVEADIAKLNELNASKPSVDEE